MEENEGVCLNAHGRSTKKLHPELTGSTVMWAASHTADQILYQNRQIYTIKK